MSRLSKAERHAVKREVRKILRTYGMARVFLVNLPRAVGKVAMAELRKRARPSINRDAWVRKPCA